MGDMADQILDDMMCDHDWSYEMPPKKKAAAKVAKTLKTPKATKLELLLRSIVERFPNDPTAPGLAIAWLPQQGHFYVAIRRFHGPYGAQPKVYIAVQHASLLKAMSALVTRYKEEISKTSATEEFLRLK